MAEHGGVSRCPALPLSLVSATRALEWVDGTGFSLRCGDVAVSRTILSQERVRVVMSAEGENRSVRAIVQDPCGASSDDGWLQDCHTARQVSIEVSCAPNTDQPVFVYLANE